MSNKTATWTDFPLSSVYVKMVENTTVIPLKIKTIF